MAKYFLGVDAGGTKTHALIADETGQALGFGADGAGNYQTVGFDGQQRVFKEVTHQALTMAGLRLDNISAAGFGLGGYDWPSQHQAHFDSAKSIGLTCPIELANDAVIGLLAGSTRGWGVSVIAGTSNNCRGRDKNGREGRITGEGIRFGEYGGAGELVAKAIQEISYEWTQRGPHTLLTKMFLVLTHAKDLDDLIEGIDLDRYQPNASWALTVFQAGYSGDPVAREVIAWSARELGESACAVIRQLNLQDEDVEIIEVGSLFEGGTLFTEPLMETIRAVAPKSQFIRLNVPPVVGGVMLAMQRAGIDITSVRTKLIDTTRAIINQQ